MGFSPCCTLIETASSVIKVGIENMYKVKKKKSEQTPSILPSDNPHLGSCQIYNPGTGGYLMGCGPDTQLQHNYSSYSE